jgi:hypothetical protein
VGIEFAEFEDTPKADIISSEVEYGSMTAYSYLQDLENTLKIVISDDVSNNVDIVFIVKVWSRPNQEYLCRLMEINQLIYQILITVTKNFCLHFMNFNCLKIIPNKSYFK